MYHIKANKSELTIHPFPLYTILVHKRHKHFINHINTLGPSYRFTLSHTFAVNVSMISLVYKSTFLINFIKRTFNHKTLNQQSK